MVTNNESESTIEKQEHYLSLAEQRVDNHTKGIEQLKNLGFNDLANSLAQIGVYTPMEEHIGSDPITQPSKAQRVGTSIAAGVLSGLTLLALTPQQAYAGNNDGDATSVLAPQTTASLTPDMGSFEEVIAKEAKNIESPDNYLNNVQDTIRNDTTKTRASFNLSKFGAPQFEFERTPIDEKQELSIAKLDSVKTLAKEYNQLMQKFEDYIDDVRLDLGPTEIEQIKANKDSAVFLYNDAASVKANMDRLMNEATRIMNEIPKTSIDNQKNFIKSIDDALAGKGIVYDRESAEPQQEEKTPSDGLAGYLKSFNSVAIEGGFGIALINDDDFGNTKGYIKAGLGVHSDKGTDLMLGVLYNPGGKNTLNTVDSTLRGEADGLPAGMELHVLTSGKTDYDPIVGFYGRLSQDVHKNLAVQAGYMFIPMTGSQTINETLEMSYPDNPNFDPIKETDIGVIDKERNVSGVNLGVVGKIPLGSGTLELHGNVMYDMNTQEYTPNGGVTLKFDL